MEDAITKVETPDGKRNGVQTGMLTPDAAEGKAVGSTDSLDIDSKSIASTQSKRRSGLRNRFASFGIIPTQAARKAKALAKMNEEAGYDLKKLRRQAQYIDDKFGDVVFEEELEDSFEHRKLSSKASRKTAVILVTRLRTSDSRSMSYLDSSEPPPVRQLLGNRIVIKSKAIIAALLSIVSYYPGQLLGGESVEIDEPYHILVHYEKELAKYREDHAPGASMANEVCENQRDVQEDLRILQDVMRDEMSEKVMLERQRHERGFCTFTMLWLLFKPGTDVYSDFIYSDHGNWNRYVIHYVTGGSTERVPTAYYIAMWYLDFDGVKMGRRSAVMDILPFEGEKEISSLHCIPCDYFQDVDSSGNPNKVPISKRLEDRGKLFVSLTKTRSMYYNGLTSTWPRRKYEGLIIVDVDEYYTYEKPRLPEEPLLMAPDESSLGVTNCICSVCSARQRQISIKARFADYDSIPSTSFDTLTPHQYQLCAFEIPAFHCKSRSWQTLYVESCSEPQWDPKMIDRLVIPSDRRRLIRDLSKSYMREDADGTTTVQGPWNASTVKGKGGGLVFLLHGKPGIGKTYTAECVAEYTRRPLLSLGCADLGTDPFAIEKTLTRWFKRGKQWGAIMLVDEADVYMERRITQDLERNALVAGFLRALEYYDGLLFLTTNRVGSFDDAFVSRIHVSLYYPDFSDEDRTLVWQNFFDKLAREREETIRVPIDTRDYTSGQEVRALKWNGREIGNAFQTAVALAEVEGDTDQSGRIIVKQSHLQQIVRMSRDFKRYLDELHTGDEGKRAEREKTRYDSFT